MMAVQCINNKYSDDNMQFLISQRELRRIKFDVGERTWMQ